MRNLIVLGVLTLTTIEPVWARSRSIPDEINYRQFDRQLQELEVEEMFLSPRDL